MNRTTLTKLGLPLGFAALATGSLWLYSRALRNEVEGGQRESIVVANEEVPAGARITRASLATREVPVAFTHPLSIKKGEESQIIGRAVASRIEPAQQLLWSDFDLARSASARGLSALVSRGQRALTLPVDASASLAGMLRPGDRVDLLGTFSRAQGADWATVTLLQNVPVLAIGDQRTAGDAEEAPVAPGSRAFSTITVSVDLEEAELLVFAMHRGPVNVVLRSRDDMETIGDVPDKNFSDVFESHRRAEFAERHAHHKIKELKAAQ